MALVGRRNAFSPPPGAFERQAVPVCAVLACSLVPLVTGIATFPILPPLGLVMLLAWRVSRTGLWPAWAGLPLGFFNDLFSGQPIGTAMCLWTLALLAIDYADFRLLWRGYRQDWSLATIVMAITMAGGWVLEAFGGGGTPFFLILPQMIVAILIFPMMGRLCARLDAWRLAR